KREGRAVGVGLGYFIETSGLGPWEYARVEVDPRGKVMVYVGCASVGQGVETSLSQIAADALSVNPEDVIIVHGDTNLVPFGMGSNASRTTVMAGSAVFRACEKVKERLFQLAVGALEIDLGDLELANGRVTARGVPERSLSFVELAHLAAPTPALKIGIQPGISEFDFFPMTKRAYPYGVHVAQVEVDRETGIVKILRYLLSEDIGRAVNPMLVEGQMVGGLAQGFGGAFLEEFAFSSDGQPLATSFMDYLLPTAMEVPHVETLSVEECRSPWNPLGVKGAGEGGIVAAGGAIANAVSDALGMEVTRLPMKPEYVRELALRGSKK
ncbi:MAG: molybdopterin-dependent oxidoreductase, partial [Dehalococcoidia bacterium]|nr:molybdopterin-dependent oxidoreductase [Dehalococcoidia bacterium]